MVQTCVVTLDPVTTRIDQPVRRASLPAGRAARAEVVVDPDEDDEIEPLGDRIDLGLVAIEALALALPAYPRKPGRRRSARRPRPPRRGRRSTRREPKPFAALAALRGEDRATAREIARRLGLARGARNRYVPRFVFLSGPAAAGVTSRAGICYRRGPTNEVIRAAARQRSRSRDGCSEEQGHARQARHAPVA